MKIIDDPKIKGQKFCCINFIDHSNDLEKTIKLKTFNFLNLQLKKGNSILNSIDQEKFNNDYEDFLIQHYNILLPIFLKTIGNKPYKKILKIRGVFPTIEEANEKIKKLEKQMKKKEPIRMYLAEVGKWIPFLTNETNGLNLQDNLNYTLYEYLEKLNYNDHDFQKRRSNDGSKNIQDPGEYIKREYKKENDYLNEDEEIPFQKYMIVSFYEPEQQVQQSFLEMTLFSFVYSFLVDQLNLVNMNNDTKKEISKNDLSNEYGKYIIETNIELETSKCIPCFKLKGVYPDDNRVNKSCENFQIVDENFDVFVGKVGVWLEFDPLKRNMEIKYQNKDLEKLCNDFEKEEKKTELMKNRLKKANYNVDNFTFGTKLREN